MMHQPAYELLSAFPLAKNIRDKMAVHVIPAVLGILVLQHIKKDAAIGFFDSRNSLSVNDVQRDSVFQIMDYAAIERLVNRLSVRALSALKRLKSAPIALV